MTHPPAEIVTIKGKKYLLLDGYIAVPISRLREKYVRGFSDASRKGSVRPVKSSMLYVVEEPDDESADALREAEAEERKETGSSDGQ